MEAGDDEGQGNHHGGLLNPAEWAHETSRHDSPYGAYRPSAAYSGFIRSRYLLRSLASLGGMVARQ